MMSVSLEIGVIEGRRPLDGLPGLVQLKCTASQRWQVRLIWVKLGGSATAGIRADHTQSTVISSSFGFQNYFRKPFQVIQKREYAICPY